MQYVLYTFIQGDFRLDCFMYFFFFTLSLWSVWHDLEASRSFDPEAPGNRFARFGDTVPGVTCGGATTEV